MLWLGIQPSRAAFRDLRTTRPTHSLAERGVPSSSVTVVVVVVVSGLPSRVHVHARAQKRCLNLLHCSRPKFGTTRRRRRVPFSDQISSGPDSCPGRDLDLSRARTDFAGGGGSSLVRKEAKATSCRARRQQQ